MLRYAHSHSHTYGLHESESGFVNSTYSHTRLHISSAREQGRVRNVYTFVFTYIWHSTKARQSSWFVHICIYIHMTFHQSETEFVKFIYSHTHSRTHGLLRERDRVFWRGGARRPCMLCLLPFCWRPIACTLPYEKRLLKEIYKYEKRRVKEIYIRKRDVYIRKETGRRNQDVSDDSNMHFFYTSLFDICTHGMHPAVYICHILMCIVCVWICVWARVFGWGPIMHHTVNRCHIIMW